MLQNTFDDCKPRHSFLPSSFFAFSQPAPAYDLLVRFLTKKTMIDDELPQVRSEKHTSPQPLSWVHLYPTGKEAYKESFSDTPVLSLQDVAKNTEATLTDHGMVGAHHMGQTSPAGGLLAAFVAGLVVALMVAQFMNRRQRRHTGYTAVPDHVQEMTM